jgi:3-hydroxyacyl-[acyl-carrier-protein] dehydratase
VAFELIEKRREQLRPIDGRAGLDAQRRRRRVHVRGELVFTEIRVDADPEHDSVVARLGEDARHLASADQKVVRESDFRSHAGLPCDRVGRSETRDDRELREAGDADLGAKVDRDEHACPGWSVPRAPESASARRLLLGDGDGAFRGIGPKLPLSRFATLEIEVGTAEPTAEQRLHVRRGQRVVTHLGETRLTWLSALTREEIEAILPHRDPFLLLDEVVDLVPGERVVARKRVRPDEWYLRGHFPGRPIMPGVLIVEAMAQAGAVAVLSEEENRGKLALFAGIDGVRFKRVVEPGDELELTCELERVRGPIGKGKATARVDGQLAARGTLTFAVEQ